MSTGGSIFFTVLLLFAVLFLLGYLVHNTIDMSGEVQQAQQAGAECQQSYSQQSADLDSTQIENQRLESENQDLRNLVQTLRQTVEAERQGRLRAEAEAPGLQQRVQAAEQLAAGKQALSEVAVAQASIWKGQVDQLTPALNQAQAQNQELSRQNEELKQANAFLQAIGVWLSMKTEDKLAASLVTGGLATGSIMTAAAGLYARRRRGLLLRPGKPDRSMPTRRT